MHDRLVEVLDRVDALLASAVDVAPESALDPTARAVRRIRLRLDYPADLAIVALAGGTGSGKSSLFNALLDSQNAEIGGIRPTTSRAMASVPVGRRTAIEGYLNSFGVSDVHTHDRPSWLVLVDLPDTDSVEVDHRLQVDSLLPHVDAVVWVVDVEKYRDEALHRGYLRPLVAYESQFVFVLNQIDRVTTAEAGEVVADFRRSISDDGYPSATVFSTAADPKFSGRKGIDDLMGQLESLADGLVFNRILADLEVGAGELGRVIGPASLEFEARWANVLDEAMEHLKADDVIGASRAISRFFAALGDQLEGMASEAALGLSAHSGEILRAEIEKAEISVPTRPRETGRWRRAKATDQDERAEDRIAHVRESLDQIVTDQVRPRLRQRATVMANLTGLVVELTEIQDSLDG
jgi:GTP-binding protein EngB required for normal cell division